MATANDTSAPAHLKHHSIYQISENAKPADIYDYLSLKLDALHSMTMAMDTQNAEESDFDSLSMYVKQAYYWNLQTITWECQELTRLLWDRLSETKAA